MKIDLFETTMESLRAAEDDVSVGSSYHYGSQSCLSLDVEKALHISKSSEVRINDVKSPLPALESFSINNPNKKARLEHPTTDAGDDDYGFYDELEAGVDDPTTLEDLGSTTNASSSLVTTTSHRSSQGLTSSGAATSVTSTTSSSSATAVKGGSIPRFTVVCELENKKAPVACRSFEIKPNSSSSQVGICATCCSIEGFRIVQDAFQELPEYKVKLTLDNKDYICWRRFCDFEVLAMACLEFRKSREALYPLVSQSEKQEFLRSTFPKTVAAWHAVEKNRPWWNSKVTVDFITTESRLLINFMKQILFETPSVNMLIEFMN